MLYPKLFPATFEKLPINENQSVQFISVMPIYKEEKSFKRKHGTKALLNHFKKFGISSIIDSKRNNTCQEPPDRPDRPTKYTLKASL